MPFALHRQQSWPIRVCWDEDIEECDWHGNLHVQAQMGIFGHWELHTVMDQCFMRFGLSHLECLDHLKSATQNWSYSLLELFALSNPILKNGKLFALPKSKPT